MQRRCLRFILIIAGITLSTTLCAEESNKEIARAALNGLKINHYAEHISAPLQEYVNFDYGVNNTQSIFYFKPVVPFRITPKYDLIIRTIVPIDEHTPTDDKFKQLNGNYIHGWGDINPTFFLTTAKFNKFLMGFGPSISIPTSTNTRYIGTGKWSLGPELAVYYMPENWVMGFLVSNVWSFAGDVHRPSVNAFQFEYGIAYLFEKGWYIATNPTITANWKSPGNQQWIIPFGLGAGRAMKVGQQPMHIGLYGNYNVIRPSQVGPNWQLELQVEWLFPSSPAVLH